MDNVFITQTSHFFPNEPVPNDEMEDYLGLINNHKSLSRPIVLRNNGIKTRYYALDKKGNMTHSSIQMAANAIRGLEEDGFKLADADVLAYGTATPEQFACFYGARRTSRIWKYRGRFFSWFLLYQRRSLEVLLLRFGFGRCQRSYMCCF